MQSKKKFKTIIAIKRTKKKHRKTRELYSMDSFRNLLKDQGHFEDIFLEFRKDKNYKKNGRNTLYFIAKNHNNFVL